MINFGFFKYEQSGTLVLLGFTFVYDFCWNLFSTCSDCAFFFCVYQNIIKAFGYQKRLASYFKEKA